VLARIVFWGGAAALAWTHVGYPLAAGTAARLRPRPVRRGDGEPSVSLIVAAHDEQDVIERRVENLLQLDYPADKLEVVVASDASADRTDELVEGMAGRDGRVRLIKAPRGGKVAAQNLAVRETSGEILAFSDANATWQPDALRKLVRSFADSDVAYVTGRATYADADGTNREGAYWAFELWLREQESQLGSVTGGNGPIYAVRRDDYVDVDPRFGHDLAFPYLMVQRGRRAVYEPEAISVEKPSRDLEDEYRRKVRMFEHCWLITLRGGMLRDVDRVYLAELISHRVLRYGTGLLHLGVLAANVALLGRRRVYDVALAKQAAFLALAVAGRQGVRVPGAALAYYYVLVTWATVVSLAGYLRHGVPPVWEKAEGTR
jgi:cellulose synthase/poly-beta-1,6-N-acetylglucosamine synthase-like glycosyltransferase